MLTIRRAPLALACLVLLGAACSQQGGSGGAAAPSPRPSSLAARSQTSERPVSQPIRSAPQHASSTPKGSQSPSLSAVYANALQVDAQHLLAADSARIVSCAGRDTAGCRSALQQVMTFASALQRDLDANPAPACMQTADATLRSAISFYVQGAQLGTSGIDDGSTSEVMQGTSLLDQGGTRFRAASTQLGQSGCSVGPPSVAP